MPVSELSDSASPQPFYIRQRIGGGFTETCGWGARMWKFIPFIKVYDLSQKSDMEKVSGHVEALKGYDGLSQAFTDMVERKPKTTS